MNKYSKRSIKHLYTCHSDLIMLFEDKILPHWDHSIIEGFRGEEDQNEAHHRGLSDKEWPDSKHNLISSEAVHACPWPIDWDDIERFRVFGGFVIAMGISHGLKIRWGGDWDGDWDLKDQKLIDLAHFEIIL